MKYHLLQFALGFLIVSFTISCHNKRANEKKQVSNHLIISKIESKLRIENVNNAGIKQQAFLDYKIKLTYGCSFFLDEPLINIYEVDSVSKTVTDISMRFYSYLYLNRNAKSILIGNSNRDNLLNENMVIRLSKDLIDSRKKMGTDNLPDSLCIIFYCSGLEFYNKTDTALYTIDISPLLYFITDDKFSKSKNNEPIYYKILIDRPIDPNRQLLTQQTFCLANLNFGSRVYGYEYIPRAERLYDSFMVSSSMLLQNSK